MSISDRRRATRVPLRMFLNETNESRSGRCLALNLSEEGVYVDRLAGQEGGQKPGSSQDISAYLSATHSRIRARVRAKR